MTNPRTKFEALLDVRYHVRLAELHIRLYGRIRAALAFISLMAGSSAFVGAFGSIPAVVSVAGIVVAVAGFTDLLGAFSYKQAQHQTWRQRLYELLSQSAGLTLEQIDAALEGRGGSQFDEIEALRVPAYNDNLRSNGFENLVRPMTRLQRLLHAIA